MLYDSYKNKFYLENKIFDFDKKDWLTIAEIPSEAIKISNVEAVEKLQTLDYKIKLPIGVIGTNKPNPQQYELAKNLGKALAKMGLSVICGGRAGTMEAVCKGIYEEGGISIGLLPEPNLENVNKYVSIPLATGFGLARGAMIATSSLCLIAIGGGNGTIAELANGLQFGKKIFSINSEIDLPNLKKCHSINEILDNIAKIIFNIENTQ